MQIIRLIKGEKARLIPYGEKRYAVSPDRETEIPKALVARIIDIIEPADPPKDKTKPKDKTIKPEEKE